MNINFTASEVEYNEAIDGEIIQVSFDEDPDQDPLNRTKCYLMISQNYEFPGKPTLEWHDGETDNGGSEVINYKLTNELFKLVTTNGLMFRIQHYCSEEILVKIQGFLHREFGNG